ncbi:MAG: M20/M25/M40 family metallo-hydrolase [Acidobacteria bacterium]|nr:M20/M25/M40 family metallo-hydrolase [Acidobacteriota bacterium]
MSPAAVDPVALARALVDIDSTTGREGDAGRWLAAYLRDRGYQVVEQRVDASRFNIIARAGDPAVVFSTHMDCVPPFFASRIEGDRLYGRGACDAKGILAAQVAAAERLRQGGETRVGLLFVVGEERGSDGARAADAVAPGSRYLVNGEPTDNRLGRATRGVLRLKLRASGRAAHSSYPELGESAIDALIDALVELRGIALPADALLGRTHYSVGLISGGVAPNVISPAAEAEVMFRTVGDGSAVRRAVAPLERRVAVEHVLEVPPVRMTPLDGFETAVFPYTTDIPFLSAWGRPLLFGPGSIHVAHTADEFVSIPELHEAVDRYAAIAKALLSRTGDPAPSA